MNGSMLIIDFIWTFLTTGFLVFLLLLILKLKDKVTNKKILKLVFALTIASLLLDILMKHTFPGLFSSFRLSSGLLYYLIRTVIFFIILYFLTEEYWGLDKKTTLKFSILYGVIVLAYEYISLFSIYYAWFGSPIMMYINFFKYKLLPLFR